MTQQPKLTQTEWELVMELIESERRELPTELHHTDDPTVRQELRARKLLVESLSDRLREAIAV